MPNYRKMFQHIEIVVKVHHNTTMTGKYIIMVPYMYIL
jgi:hypothetical protein